MKKVVIALLLIVAPCLVGVPHLVAQSGGEVKLDDPAEANAYNNAIGQADPKARAAALDGFLTQYPNSKVKNSALETMMNDYAQSGNVPKAIDAASRLVAAEPNNLDGLASLVFYKRATAGDKPDAATLDQISQYAQRGLSAPKSMDVSMDTYNKQKAAATPIFHGALGFVAFQKKDYKTATTEFTAELTGMPIDQTKAGNGLLDTYTLGQAYVSEYQALKTANSGNESADTSDALTKGFWFLTRAAMLAPEPYHSQILKEAQYWYKHYHGAMDGFDAIQTQAQATLLPPATLSTTVTKAPSPADIANNLVATTPDLTTLALSDREFILQYASQENEDKLWTAMKGKTTQIPGLVISATQDTVQLAVSDDSQAAKTADVTVKMAAALKTVPMVGSQVTLVGTYDSYVKNPFMITMVDGQPTEKPKAPVHHTAHH
jgi:hypothetical protein